jgi:pimeloyl-ACP methyl ester carboxylesterase
MRLTRIPAIALLSLTLTLQVFAQQSPSGAWKGVMTHDGAETEVRFDFHEHQGHLAGTFTSLPQRAVEYPFDEVTYAAPKLHIVLGGGSVIFDGILTQKTLQGTFHDQETGDGTFHLERFTPAPPPYSAEEVKFSNGSVVLAGSLYIPKTPGAHPAIVFLHGSGPEVRWGANRFWADYFARRGIAALIYDKRGSGGSSGDWTKSDFNDLAGDAHAGIELLKGRSGIDAKQIGIFGHSQGGSIAPLVASKSSSVAFVISNAGTGIPMWESEIYSLHATVAAAGIKGEALEKADAFIHLLIDFARSGNGWEKLEAAEKSASGEPWYDIISPPTSKDAFFWPFFRKFADYNPAEYWRQVRVPVLIVQASEDVHIPAERSIAAIREALSAGGNKDFTILLLPGAPHTFVVRPKPGQRFYWPYLYPGYADLLAAWVTYRTVGRSLQ